jgi:transposase-like protein
MPRQYPPAIRNEVSRRLLAGEKISSLARELNIAAATLHRWKHQALIDHDRLPGVKSFDVDELARAKRTIQDLEAELELVKAATALFNGEVPVSPKGSSRLLKR